MARKLSIKLSIFGLLTVLLFAGCTEDSQFGGLHQEAFSVTPKCGINERMVHFKNTTGETLDLAGITLAPGTNGAGHFSIQGFTVGSDDELPADSGGGVSTNKENPIAIPAGSAYSLRVRYSPLEQSGDTVHTALIDMAFNDPNPGILQIELYGTSEGEADCPEAVTGGAAGLSGDVDLKITFMVASTGGLGVPLTTEMGVDAFTPVELSANISGTDFSFPEITSADNFFLPAPDPTNPALGPVLSVVSGDTDITSDAAVTGTFNADTGELTLPNIKVFLEDNNSTLVLDMPFTTGSVDPLSVPNDRLISGNFVIVGGDIVGKPVQDDGEVHLVGATLVTEGTGPLSSAVGLDIAVRIEATVLCKGEDDTVCDGS